MCDQLNRGREASRSTDHHADPIQSAWPSSASAARITRSAVGARTGQIVCARRRLALGAQGVHCAFVRADSAAEPTRLDAEYREAHDGHVWLSSVVLLVDGKDRFATMGSGGYIGRLPTDLASQPALVEPTHRPQEVHLYRCSCGETGCGAVVARCYRLGDDVVWDLFDSGNTPPLDLDAVRPGSDALIFSSETYERFASRLRELSARHSSDQ
jgi:hypothetical protein